jgi:hypothetical protein
VLACLCRLFGAAVAQLFVFPSFSLFVLMFSCYSVWQESITFQTSHVQSIVDGFALVEVSVHLFSRSMPSKQTATTTNVDEPPKKVGLFLHQSILELFH